MTMYPLLQINNLSIDFITASETVPAIKNISFEVNQGEILAIVGESGSGKTITSLSVLQLLPSAAAHSQKGEILFSEHGLEQENLMELPEKALRKIRGNKISMIFQEPMTSLNPVHTCGSQVMEAIMLHEKIPRSVARKKTIDLFNQVKLPGAATIA